MRTLLPLILLVACTGEQPAEPQPAPNPAPAPAAQPAPAPTPAPTQVSVPSAVPCPPIDGGKALESTVQRLALGEQALIVHRCAIGDGTAVQAELEGSGWSWKGDFVWEAPAFENEMLRYHFVAGGPLGDGRQVLVLSYVACDLDGCDRVRFYAVDPSGMVEILADDTQSTAWGPGPEGAFEYVERTGYSMGYHVASAAWTYRWEGGRFVRQPQPKLKAEYGRWPCPTSQVQPVDPASGQAEGEPIPVRQGAEIEVLAVDPAQPGALFQYELGEQTFWALNWTQTCAG